MFPLRHAWVGLLAASIAASFVEAASAAPPSAPKANGPCARSAERAAEDMKQGKLRRARQAFAECAEPRCGSGNQRCRSALSRLDEDIPTVVIVAKDKSGAELTEVRVSMDGEPLTDHLDGRGLPVDPGTHDFVFATAGGEQHQEKLLILEGQHNRLVSVQLEAVASPASPPVPQPATGLTTAGAEPAPLPAKQLDVKPPPRAAAAPSNTEDSRPTPVLTYVLGGVGLAAVGSSFLLAHWGSEDNLRLDRCAPNCSRDSVDHVSNMYLAADITLGAGVVALGAATWFYLARPGGEERPPSSAYRFDVKPLASGGMASVGGSF